VILAIHRAQGILEESMARDDRWLIPAKIEAELIDLWLVVIDTLREFYEPESGLPKAEGSYARFI
jgi:hypothetical protein